MDRPPRVKTSVLDRQKLTLIKLGEYQRACGLYFVYSKVTCSSTLPMKQIIEYKTN